MIRPTVFLTRGLPGSGKSTDAQKFDAVDVNRDDLRFGLFKKYTGLSWEQEEFITQAQRALAAAALAAGRNVVISDMNLRPKYIKPWNQFAIEHGAGFVIHEIYTPVEECIRRDAARERTVGEKVIRDLAQKYLKFEPDGQYWFLRYELLDPAPEPQKVIYDPLLPHCILVDIDGTMTTGPHNRNPYDWSAVGGDLPRRAVVNLVNRLLRDGYKVKFLSGRDEVCRPQTIAWLHKYIDNGYLHDVDWTLHMRPEGDNRVDSIIKSELFDQHIRGKFAVKFVLDDRDQVVRFWRSIGLATFQVDYGNF